MGGRTSLGASRSVSGISSRLMMPGDGVAGTNRPSRVRRALEVDSGALRGFVTPAGALSAVRGVLSDPLEAFPGADLVAATMTECWSV